MKRRMIIMAVTLAVVFGGLYGFAKFRENAIANYFATVRPPPTPVDVELARAEAIPRFVSGIGSLVAVHQVTVTAEIGGRVVNILFEPGAAVKQGDPLVQLNDAPEQGDLLNYRAQAKLAEVSLARARELLVHQNAAQQTVDQNQAALDQARANISKTEALIAQKLIRAPFAGVLGIRQVDLGQYINPGAAVVTLTDLATLYANFTLPEQQRSQIETGRKVEVAIDAYPARTFPGTVTTIEPQIDINTRTIKVQATLANPDNLLQPGMFANVRVELPVALDVVTVPETAVDYTLYGDSVFIVGEEGRQSDGKPVLKVTRTFVKTGDRFNNRVVILSGVKPGDRVVTSGQLKLQSGTEVVVAPSNSLTPPNKLPNT